MINFRCLNKEFRNTANLLSKFSKSAQTSTNVGKTNPYVEIKIFLGEDLATVSLPTYIFEGKQKILLFHRGIEFDSGGWLLMLLEERKEMFAGPRAWH